MANFSPRHCKLVTSTISCFKVGSNFNAKLNCRNIFNVSLQGYARYAVTLPSEDNLLLAVLRETVSSKTVFRSVISAFSNAIYLYMHDTGIGYAKVVIRTLFALCEGLALLAFICLHGNRLEPLICHCQVPGPL